MKSVIRRVEPHAAGYRVLIEQEGYYSKDRSRFVELEVPPGDRADILAAVRQRLQDDTIGDLVGEEL